MALPQRENTTRVLPYHPLAARAGLRPQRLLFLVESTQVCRAGVQVREVQRKRPSPVLFRGEPVCRMTGN